MGEGTASATVDVVVRRRGGGCGDDGGDDGGEDVLALAATRSGVGKLHEIGWEEEEEVVTTAAAMSLRRGGVDDATRGGGANIVMAQRTMTTHDGEGVIIQWYLFYLHSVSESERENR